MRCRPHADSRRYRIGLARDITPLQRWHLVRYSERATGGRDGRPKEPVVYVSRCTPTLRASESLLRAAEPPAGYPLVAQRTDRRTYRNEQRRRELADALLLVYALIGSQRSLNVLARLCASTGIDVSRGVLGAWSVEFRWATRLPMLLETLGMNDVELAEALDPEPESAGAVLLNLFVQQPWRVHVNLRQLAALLEQSARERDRREEQETLLVQVMQQLLPGFAEIVRRAWIDSMRAAPLSPADLRSRHRVFADQVVQELTDLLRPSGLADLMDEPATPR